MSAAEGSRAGAFRPGQGTVELTEGPPIPEDVPASRVARDLTDVVRRLAGRSYGLRVVVVPSGVARPDLAEAVARQLRRRGAAPELLPAGTTGIDLSRADVLVDLGDGRPGPADDAARAAVVRASARARSRGLIHIAGGVPAGVVANGAVLDGAAPADVTVTWGVAPRAVLLYPGRVHVGRHVHRPQEDAGPAVRGWSALTVVGASPGPYDMNTDKDDRGTVLAVAGSRQSAGAASATGVAALKSGAGLVAVATPEPAHLVLSMQHPGLRVLPLPSDDGHLAERAVSDVMEEVDRYQVVLAGPGLAPQAATRRLVDLLRARADRLVLDADALTVHADDPEVLRDHVGELVLTPNAQELARLGGEASATPRRHAGETAEQAPALARRYRATIVAKGTRTVVAAPDGRVWITPTGNPGLSTGGSGDILAGMVAAAIAGADDVALAVARAAWWHGLVGDLAAEPALGRTSATDLLSVIPDAFGTMGRLTEEQPLFPFSDRLDPAEQRLPRPPPAPHR